MHPDRALPLLAACRRRLHARALLALAALLVLLQLGLALHASNLDQHLGHDHCLTCLALAQVQAPGTASAPALALPVAPRPTPLAAARPACVPCTCLPPAARAPPACA